MMISQVTKRKGFLNSQKSETVKPSQLFTGIKSWDPLLKLSHYKHVFPHQMVKSPNEFTLKEES